MNKWETENSRCEYIEGEPDDCKALRWDWNSQCVHVCKGRISNPLKIHFDLGFDRIESEPQHYLRTKPNLAKVNRKIVKTKWIVKNSQIENNNKW